MNSLFSLPESLSPRLAWMKKYGVRTSHAGLGSAVHTQWTATAEINGDGDEEDTEGETEDIALFKMSRLLGVRAWNEE